MAQQKFPLETIVSRAKRRGFVYPGSDIYGGLANARDYGPYGSQLRKNILDTRRKFFVQQQENIVGIDGAILMHPKVREASGHVATFNDPLVDDKNTGERFRADKLIEASLDEVRKLYTEEQILQEVNINIEAHNLTPASRTLEQQRQYLIHYKVKNPVSKKEADRTDVRKFSLMLSTHLGVIEDESAKVRLRPETAQTMFVDFKNVIDTTRVRVPFGIAQVGKSFRNEITPGNFLFRTREFEQMEIQMFVHPTQSDERFDKFFEMSRHYRKELLGVRKDNLRLRDHDKDELAHYCKKARDFEYDFPRGRGELQGVHDRGNFDLTQHQEFSKQNLQYIDPITGERYLPNVVELSMGLSRTLATVMIDAYEEEEYTNSNGEKETRTVARFSPNIAPVKFAIFPLIKKDEAQMSLSKKIFSHLSQNYYCEFDDNGAIGKRYRRQDEIGTPYCITVDHQSIQDGTVTIRDRDTMEQKRVKWEEISL